MTVPSTMSVEAGSVGCNTEELAGCGSVIFAYSSYARGWCTPLAGHDRLLARRCRVRRAVVRSIHSQSEVLISCFFVGYQAEL